MARRPLASRIVFTMTHRRKSRFRIQRVRLAFVRCALLLLMVCFIATCNQNALAFAPSHSTYTNALSAGQTPRVGKSQRDPKRHWNQSRPNELRTLSSVLRLAKSSLSPTVTATTDFYVVATKLLDLVLEQRIEDVQPTWKVLMRRDEFQESRKNRSSRIEALIEELTRPTLQDGQISSESANGIFTSVRNKSEPSTYYDPSESLFGSGFYCTLYFYYPNAALDDKPPEDPIWEQTSLLRSNIKGQQYYVRNDFSQAVINYSEVWGPSVAISAEGSLTPIDDKVESTVLPTSRIKPGSKSLRRLPDIFRVDATQISVSLFGISWKFEISGSANLVVIYADPRIRIFVSPLPSKTVVGNWEQAGLVVVQVRSDLVPTKNERTLPILDLR